MSGLPQKPEPAGQIRWVALPDLGAPDHRRTLYVSVEDALRALLADPAGLLAALADLVDAEAERHRNAPDPFRLRPVQRALEDGESGA